MERETPHDELMRLLKAQLKAQRDEVFGGFSQAEQAEYDSRAERIRELENSGTGEAQIWRSGAGEVIVLLSVSGVSVERARLFTENR